MKKPLLILLLCLSGFLFADNKLPEFWKDLQQASLQNAFGGKTAGKDCLKGKKLIGIYFSAHWCPPCRKFTPQLVKIHKEAPKDQLEIIFVSNDRNDKEMQKYMTETQMPWVAVPFADAKLRRKLGNQFNISAIPTLIILDAKGNVITRNGVREIQKEGAKALKTWEKRTAK